MLKLLTGISAMFVLSACASQVTQSQRFPDQASIYPLALKGDLRPVLYWFSHAEETQLSPAERELKQKYLARFSAENQKAEPPLTGFTGEVLRIHQRYWRKALRHDFSSEDEGYRFLFDDLRALAERREKKFGAYGEQETEKLEQYIKATLLSEGYYSLLGQTKPYMELMLWKKETAHSYPVNLGDESISVKVVMMDDFVTYGWLGYATFNDKKTGGWAEKDLLRCVSPSYDTQSEQFRVSYLAHEGRHFADFKKFPKLESADLEYRAKLTELILADKTFAKLLRHFIEEAADDRASGHAYASFNLTRHLGAKLGKNLALESIDGVDHSAVKAAAQTLLQEHTNQLKALGPSETRGIFAF